MATAEEWAERAYAALADEWGAPDADVETIAYYVRQAVAEEREACRNVAMNWEPEVWKADIDVAAGVAKAIRERGNHAAKDEAPGPGRGEP